MGSPEISIETPSGRIALYDELQQLTQGLALDEAGFLRNFQYRGGKIASGKGGHRLHLAVMDDLTTTSHLEIPLGPRNFLAESTQTVSGLIDPNLIHLCCSRFPSSRDVRVTGAFHGGAIAFEKGSGYTVNAYKGGKEEILHKLDGDEEEALVRVGCATLADGILTAREHFGKPVSLQQLLAVRRAFTEMMKTALNGSAYSRQ